MSSTRARSGHPDEPGKTKLGAGQATLVPGSQGNKAILFNLYRDDNDDNNTDLEKEDDDEEDAVSC